MKTDTKDAKPYHHGNLRESLLAAARRLLETEGHSNLSLRKCAQAVGVSATAPQNHFANKEALLTALAAQGYAELETYMKRGAHETADRVARRQAALLGYVAFAQDHPAMYELMFARDRVSSSDPNLMRHVGACFVILADLSKDFGRYHGDAAEVEAKQQMFAWSLVHGYAQLLTDNRFKKDAMQGMNILDIIPDLGT
ncbi:TetR/AcrR family transcriptional regulator [uncultured Sulfitobacter sp.]|uniref:TetR/AcrR family transcriptional regulator n=1 Tax=Sulfitobacter sp. SH22 TaxID=3421172 RepID=UPI0025F1453A|nr:TetR/AcrR family transcriptional regulator [uncultured Sulfitobacter sp.]